MLLRDVTTASQKIWQLMSDSHIHIYLIFLVLHVKPNYGYNIGFFVKINIQDLPKYRYNQ